MYVFLSSTISYFLTKQNMVSLPNLTVYLLLFIWGTKKQEMNARNQNLGKVRAATDELILSQMHPSDAKWLLHANSHLEEGVQHSVL